MGEETDNSSGLCDDVSVGRSWFCVSPIIQTLLVQIFSEEAGKSQASLEELLRWSELSLALKGMSDSVALEAL